MLFAADENNKVKFLSYQDNTDEVFFKEQETWLETLKQKKEEGWKTSLGIQNIHVDSSDKGSLQIVIKMKLEDMEVTNRITFPISKGSGEWKLQDIPFEKITEGPLHLYYQSSHQAFINDVMVDLSDIIKLYSDKFDWDVDNLHVKLYKNIEEISASTAYPQLSGVAIPFVSAKFLLQDQYSDMNYNFMKHEVVHMMLSDLTNENAPDFMHEGLATLVSHSVIKDTSGKPQLDWKNAEEQIKVVLGNTPELVPIEQLNDLNYTADGVFIYNVGTLITNYLIQTHGFDKYLEVLKLLKEQDIVEFSHPNRTQIVFERAVNALEKIYGPIDELSKGYIEYYNKMR